VIGDIDQLSAQASCIRAAPDWSEVISEVNSEVINKRRMAQRDVPYNPAALVR
jgi:hypothetical protein